MRQTAFPWLLSLRGIRCVLLNAVLIRKEESSAAAS